jgi:hypothetical protein
MATYLDSVSGLLTQKAPINTTTGATDAAKIIETDAGGLIAESFLPAGILTQVKVLVASEDLAAGDFVNVWNDTGTAKVRKANASTSGKLANGFVKASVLSAANATVYFEGINDQVTGATAGKVWLSASTAGGFESSAPTGSGNAQQAIGTAVSATEIDFEAQQPIVLA